MRPTSVDSHDIPFTSELSRKLLHLVALVIPVTALVVGRTWAIALLLPLSLIAVGADVLRTRNQAFSHFIDRVFGFMMRPSERQGVGAPVIFNGATWVLIAAATLAVVFPLSIGMPAFIVFMVADAVAALLGRRLGRHRWPGTTRTIEGSLAFFVTGVIIYSVWGGLALWAILIVVAFGAAAEALPGPLNDNIRVPVVMATIIYILSLAAPIIVPLSP